MFGREATKWMKHWNNYVKCLPMRCAQHENDGELHVIKSEFFLFFFISFEMIMNCTWICRMWLSDRRERQVDCFSFLFFESKLESVGGVRSQRPIFGWGRGNWAEKRCDFDVAVGWVTCQIERVKRMPCRVNASISARETWKIVKLPTKIARHNENALIHEDTVSISPSV